MLFCVIGEAVADTFETGGGFTTTPGGSPLNVAVGLARLGQHACVFARFSTDAVGDLLRDYAVRNGVDVSRAPRASEPATTVVISLDAGGNAHYDFTMRGSADWQWTAGELKLPEGTDYLHTGSIAAWVEPGASRIADLRRQVHADKRIVISYDPNIRPSLQPDHSQIEDAVRHSHVVKASHEDVAWLYPDLDEEQIAAKWLGLGAQLVVLTRGSSGARAFTATAWVRRPAPAIHVVDTVGAGDAFMSGLLDGLAEAGISSPAALASIDEPRLVRLLDRAILFSAMTCEREGADPPTRPEFEAALKPGR